MTAETETQTDAKTAKRRPLSAKSITKIVEKINAMTDPVAARKRRKKLGERLIRQIAADEVRNPAAAARALLKGAPKAETAEADSDDEG